MSVSMGLQVLFDYTDHERRKWRDWLATDPARLRIPVQPGGRFPTVADLLDHLFLVERRHLARLEGGTPPNSTGVPSGDLDSLFDYAELVRRDFRHYMEEIDEDEAGSPLSFTLNVGDFTLRRRDLALSILLHEVRHFAQIALAARIAGHQPPGEHDFLFFANEVRT
jgi:uncharacterized damage-inducible protein DinB